MTAEMSARGARDQADKVVGVLIADPDPIVRFGLSAIFESENDLEVIGEAETPEGLLGALAGGAPGVLVVEPELGGMPGPELLSTVLERFTHIPVLALTQHYTDLSVLETLRTGVQGFLTKRVSAETILQAVRALAAGEHYLDPTVTSLVIGQVGRRRERRRVAARHLTDRERAVLKLLVEGKRNKDIAEALYVSERTVKFHLRTLYQKLRVSNRTEAVSAAIKQGLVNPSSRPG